MEIARSEGISVEAVVKREAADPAAIRRMLEVEEVADCIVFLASNVPVDGRESRLRWTAGCRELSIFDRMSKRLELGRRMRTQVLGQDTVRRRLDEADDFNRDSSSRGERSQIVKARFT